MATKKTSENEVKKTTKKAKTEEKVVKEKATKATKESKAESKVATKKVEKVADEVSANKLEELQNEFEKIKAELSIIKQFKNNSDKSPSDKVFAELEKLKEIIFGLEDRIEELEYQVSEKDDY